MPTLSRFVALIVLAGGLDFGVTPRAFAGAVDQYGDPLPAGAIARLGAKRFRHDGLCLSLTYSGDGKYIHWTNLIDADAAKAYRSIGTLLDAPGQSVRFLGGHLHPASRIDEGKIKQAIVNLNSEKFATRQAASKELLKIGGQAVPHIQEAMTRNPPLETRRRLDEIVNKLDDVPGPETLRNMRAIMVLERIGTPEARAVLTTLAAGAPGARETVEAKESLERLANQLKRLP